VPSFGRRNGRNLERGTPHPEMHRVSRVLVLFTSTMLRKAGMQHFTIVAFFSTPRALGRYIGRVCLPARQLGQCWPCFHHVLPCARCFSVGLISLGWHGVFGMHLVGPTKLPLPDHCKLGKTSRNDWGTVLCSRHAARGLAISTGAQGP